MTWPVRRVDARGPTDCPHRLGHRGRRNLRAGERPQLTRGGAHRCAGPSVGSTSYPSTPGAITPTSTCATRRDTIRLGRAYGSEGLASRSLRRSNTTPRRMRPAPTGTRASTIRPRQGRSRFQPHLEPVRIACHSCQSPHHSARATSLLTGSSTRLAVMFPLEAGPVRGTRSRVARLPAGPAWVACPNALGHREDRTPAARSTDLETRVLMDGLSHGA